MNDNQISRRSCDPWRIPSGRRRSGRTRLRPAGFRRDPASGHQRPDQPVGQPLVLPLAEPGRTLPSGGQDRIERDRPAESLRFRDSQEARLGLHDDFRRRQLERQDKEPTDGCPVARADRNERGTRFSQRHRHVGQPQRHPRRRRHRKRRRSAEAGRRVGGTEESLRLCRVPEQPRRSCRLHVRPHGWGVEVCKRVGSPYVKILYDIYHAQIMEGDIIRTIRTHKDWIGHYHTGGNPGRNEIDETQELYYPAIMRAIVETGFTGYVAHEFVPKRDPLTSLAQAAKICDV
jgi:hypothetical protein